MPSDPKKSSIDWPLAYSKKQASELLGWPVAFITQCQKAGCPAFKHSRVYLGELVTWVGNRTGANDNAAEDYKAEHAKFIRVKRERLEGKLIDIHEVRAEAASIQGLLFNELERVLLNEWPAQAKGLDELAIRAISKKFLEQFREAIKTKIAALGGE